MDKQRRSLLKLAIASSVVMNTRVITAAESVQTAGGKMKKLKPVPYQRIACDVIVMTTSSSPVPPSRNRQLETSGPDTPESTATNSLEA